MLLVEHEDGLRTDIELMATVDLNKNIGCIIFLTKFYTPVLVRIALDQQLKLRIEFQSSFVFTLSGTLNIILIHCMVFQYRI